MLCSEFLHKGEEMVSIPQSGRSHSKGEIILGLDHLSSIPAGTGHYINITISYFLSP